MIRKWSMPFIKMITIHAQMKKKWLPLAGVEEFLMTELWSDLGLKDSRRWTCSSVASILDSRVKTNQVMQEEKEIIAFRGTEVGYYLASVKIKWRYDKAGQTDWEWTRSCKAPNISWGLSILFSWQRNFFGDFTKEEWYFGVRFKGNWISM